MRLNEPPLFFTPKAACESENRSILVQLILFELLAALQSVETGRPLQALSSLPRFFPYDWALDTGHLNKIEEHARHLEASFMENREEALHFISRVTHTMEQLYLLDPVAKVEWVGAIRALFLAAEPFIALCKECENLFYFLVQNKKAIDRFVCDGYLVSLLQKIHPEGLEMLGEKMCDKYHRRGFFSQISELKLMLAEL